MSANHQAETQIEGDLSSFRQKIDLLNRSPLGFVAHSLDQPFNMRYLWMKWSGTHGDHAKDQKAKHRILGAMKNEQRPLALAERELYASASGNYIDIIENLEDTLVASAGGQEA